jgi:L-cysteine S-thiosulfotransferase
MSLLKYSGIAAGIAALLLSAPALAADGKSHAMKQSIKGHPLSELFSGYYFASKGTQAMQSDDFENPAMTWYDIGEANFSKADGAAGKGCADCHKVDDLKGVGARYPVYDEKLKTLVNVEDRINNCRKTNMQAKTWKYDSNEMLGMTIFVKAQSRGMPVSPKIDGPAAPYFEKGKAFYYQRRGQLDMSCALCHEKYAGQKIRMNTLSQGQSNGFPVYRLKWQKPGSLHRRFIGCNKQVRAKPFKRGSDEYLALELYLAWRGSGLPIETPAVRN